MRADFSSENGDETVILFIGRTPRKPLNGRDDQLMAILTVPMVVMAIQMAHETNSVDKMTIGTAAKASRPSHLHPHLEKSIMGSSLIIVTFIAGAAWGPSVSLTQTPNAERCAALQTASAEAILETAKTNGQLAVMNKTKHEIVVTAGPSRRILARLSCD